MLGSQWWTSSSSVVVHGHSCTLTDAVMLCSLFSGDDRSVGRRGSFLPESQANHAVHLPGCRYDSAGEGKCINLGVWSSTQGRLCPAYGLAKQQVLETVSSLGLSLPLAFNVDFVPQIVLLQNFFPPSCRNFFCSSGHGASSCGKALGNYQHFNWSIRGLYCVWGATSLNEGSP